jgi:hypothetical protein
MLPAGEEDWRIPWPAAPVYREKLVGNKHIFTVALKDGQQVQHAQQ